VTVPTRREVIDRMSAYLVRETRAGESPRHVVRHLLGLYQGMRGARQWRRMLSDAALLDSHGAGILERALLAVEPPRARAA
jgi:tRNA-dihydrouridine synthase A